MEIAREVEKRNLAGREPADWGEKEEQRAEDAGGVGELEGTEAGLRYQTVRHQLQDPPGRMGRDPGDLVPS